MKKWLCLFPIILVLLSGCGFHLQNETEIPRQFQTMVFYSSDPYGQLSRDIKNILIDNKVNLVTQDNNKQYPSLQLKNSQITKDTVSVYQDGKAAESQLILTVNAQVIIAGQDIHPITVKVFRSFFDNPATPLAKSTEQIMIEKEMYTQAANQLISKLRSINITELKNK